MEPFEEFEFKPLTKGLGFHKKSSDLKKQMQNSVASSAPKSSFDLPNSSPSDMDFSQPLAKPVEPKTQKEAYADLLKALEKPMTFENKKVEEKQPDLEISETLPRKANATIDAVSADAGEIQLPDLKMPLMPAMNDMPDIQEKSVDLGFGGTLNKVKPMTTGTSRGASNSPKIKILEPASFGLAAGIVDCVFVVALSLIFLVSLILVTGVNLSSVLFNSQTDLTTQISLSVLFVAVMQMYVIVARSFFGRTLGEWTFDMQLGQDDQHAASTYPLKVLWRSIVTIATGLILLPILSLLFRTDLTAKLTGLQLYRQKG